MKAKYHLYKRKKLTGVSFTSLPHALSTVLCIFSLLSKGKQYFNLIFIVSNRNNFNVRYFAG